MASSHLRLWPAVAAGAWAVVLLVASVVDLGAAPEATGGVSLPGGTALAHGVGYAVLAAACCAAVRLPGQRAVVVAVVVATLYGAGIELLQGQLPYRTMSAVDVVYNAVGAVVGVAVWRRFAPIDDRDAVNG